MKSTEINRNEQLYGPSPKVLEVIKNFNHQNLYKYIEGYSRSLLRNRLAREFGIEEGRIIVGYGVEDILRAVFNNLRKDERVLISNPSYTYYKKHLDNQGINVDFYSLRVEDESFEFNTADIIEKYNSTRPKVIIVTSPNNPTGNSITSINLERIIKAVDKATLVVLDEAYWGFDQNYKEGEFLELLNKYSNLLILRSFSKLYGLAGLRIGFGLCGNEVQKSIQWQHQYLGFSRILEEVAIAALDSKDYYIEVSHKIVNDRDWFIAEVSKIKGIKAYASKSNFVLLGFDEKYQSILEKTLSEQKELIAKIIGRGQMRVSIGLTEQVMSFVDTLKKTFYDNKNF